jgi:hypothetical protein
MQSGKRNRSVGATLMNATSSRSHSIFTIVIECAEQGGEHIRMGKVSDSLCFCALFFAVVDLIETLTL